MLRCAGCGSTQTIEEIRREHPQAIACCPERRMVDDTEERLRRLERAVLELNPGLNWDLSE